MGGDDGPSRSGEAGLKAWAKSHGERSIPIGTDLELAFEHKHELVKLDRDAMLVEVEGAVEYGHELDVEKYRERRDSTQFVRRRVERPTEDSKPWTPNPN